MFGCLGTCLGAWVKVLGVHPDLFWVAFIGQSIVAVSQVFILSLPAKLAAVWFGHNQVSSACSIGVFGNQVSVFPISSKKCSIAVGNNKSSRKFQSFSFRWKVPMTFSVSKTINHRSYHRFERQKSFISSLHKFPVQNEFCCDIGAFESSLVCCDLLRFNEQKNKLNFCMMTVNLASKEKNGQTN